jgi:hypothetical protein
MNHKQIINPHIDTYKKVNEIMQTSINQQYRSTKKNI